MKEKKYDGKFVDTDDEQRKKIMIEASHLAFEQAQKPVGPIIEIQ
jgi:hypothetical protein